MPTGSVVDHEGIQSLITRWGLAAAQCVGWGSPGVCCDPRRHLQVFAEETWARCLDERCSLYDHDSWILQVAEPIAVQQGSCTAAAASASTRCRQTCSMGDRGRGTGLRQGVRSGGVWPCVISS